jgi:hypothetical protein
MLTADKIETQLFDFDAAGPFHITKVKDADIYGFYRLPAELVVLAMFVNPDNAAKFSDWIPDDRAIEILQVTFDEAREISKSKPGTVGIAVLDNMADPIIHFVR